MFLEIPFPFDVSYLYNTYFTRAEKAPAAMSGVQCCYVYIRVYDVEFHARNRLVRLYGLTS